MALPTLSNLTASYWGQELYPLAPPRVSTLGTMEAAAVQIETPELWCCLAKRLWLGHWTFLNLKLFFLQKRLH